MLKITFDCVSKWDCNGSKWHIASDMAKGMADRNRDEQLQEVRVDGLKVHKFISTTMP